MVKPIQYCKVKNNKWKKNKMTFFWETVTVNLKDRILFSSTCKNIHLHMWHRFSVVCHKEMSLSNAHTHTHAHVHAHTFSFLASEKKFQGRR